MLNSSLKRLFIFSTIAGTCAIAATLILSQQSSSRSNIADTDVSASENSGYVLTAQERENLSNLAMLNVSEGDTHLTLTKAGDNIWRIVEQADYPAEPSTIRALLSGLSQATRAEEKTANPERYADLGLDDTQAVRVEGLDSSGASLFTVLIGNAPAQREGVYIKRADTDTTWLTGRNIALSADAGFWTDNRIFSIPPGDIKQAEITPSDSDMYKIEPRDVGGLPVWGMPDVPQGYTVKNQEILRTVMSAPSLLIVDDVAAETEKRALFSEHYLGAATYVLKDGAAIRMGVAQEPAAVADPKAGEQPENIARNVWISVNIIPPPPAEKGSEDTRTGPDYGIMQEAANNRVFSVSADSIADMLRPRADIIMLKSQPTAVPPMHDTPPLPATGE